jgi:predicted phage terminase large subunit-like protein
LRNLDKKDKKLSLYDFVKRGWANIEPRAFIDNWHIVAICDVLQGIAYDCKNDIPRELSINIPPSMTKSLLASVFWPAWVWTFWPESKWICATAEQRLTNRHARLMRDLILSEWYQDSWPLSLNKETPTEVINALGGFRMAATTGGTITGHHSDFHLGDDIVKEQDSRKSMKLAANAMEKAKDFWFITMETRRTGDHTARVLLGQRLHIKDPYGVAVKQEGYESICFPMAFNPKKADELDQRTEPGELLCEERKSPEAVAKLRKRLGPRAAGAQLDMDPHPEGGTVLNADWLTKRWGVLPSALIRALETGRSGKGQTWGTFWDFTFKGNEDSDYTVGQLWCRYVAKYYLIDQVRGQWRFTTAKQRVKDFAAKYPVARKHVFEDAANAAAIEDALKAEIAGMILEPHGGGCYARCDAASGYWQAGDILLPDGAPWLEGGDGFITEHENFTGSDADTDDQVAASGLAIIYLSSKGHSSRFIDAMTAAKGNR